MMIDLNDLSIAGQHEIKIRKLFAGKAAYERSNQTFEHPLYLLAFSNRCGSNLLAEYLRATSKFKGFHEQLNFDTVKTQSQNRQIGTFPEYIEHVTKTYGKPGCYYGFKASWSQILMLYRLSVIDMYTSVRVIHIMRKDIIGQAISLHIASQTLQWTSNQQKKAGIKVNFDAHKISNLVESILYANDAIKFICAVLEIPHIVVFYEDLVGDPAHTMRQIGMFAGKNLSQWQPHAPTISRQATALNEDFRNRYLKMTRARITP